MFIGKNTLSIHQNEPQKDFPYLTLWYRPQMLKYIGIWKMCAIGYLGFQNGRKCPWTQTCYQRFFYFCTTINQDMNSKWGYIAVHTKPLLAPWLKGQTIQNCEREAAGDGESNKWTE